MNDLKSLRIFAPAKINLYLHVTGRRDDGYHFLDSLVAFTDIGDVLHIQSAQDFSLEIIGPYAENFNEKEKDSSPNSSNLVTRAAWDFARLAQKSLNVKIQLTKNLPLGAGIGGGSSDAAATIWGLSKYWKLPQPPHNLSKLLITLGADVPVCYPARSARIQGIGDVITPYPSLPEIPIVLIYPGQPCKTSAVFTNFEAPLKEHIKIPESLNSFKDLIGFLNLTENDLYISACKTTPEIEIVLQSLKKQHTCDFSRMSGSGSSCFGLFQTEENAKTAAKKIQKDHPQWWIKTGWLGRTERY